jgi:hypothetical protein
VRFSGDPTMPFSWQAIMMVWTKFTLFLVLFLVHNIFLAPLLVFQRKTVLYGALVGAIIVAFTLFQCATGPKTPDGKRPIEMVHHGPRPPQPPDHMPPVIIGEHDIIAVVMLILMFGMNLGIKGYFKGRRDQKKLVELKKENLEQQLEYLKYQINPHFFMNTLNNIHALVDIDSERAKDTILELSKMMRFILYEGNKEGVPLNREFDFIRHYITLMRLRYTDKVRIDVDLPTETPDKTVPPLMLISFIENAFKHGISYQHPSFIDIKVEIEDGKRLRFTCQNSKADKPNQEKGGVGLANVKQRLRLLYDNNFTLNIQDNPETYNVELTIPL